MIQSTAADLNCYTGMNITEICPFKYNTGNQCAHFVSHAVGIAVGATCKNASWENRQNKAIAQGASLRANEVYNSCLLYTSPADSPKAAPPEAGPDRGTARAESQLSLIHI